MPLSIDSIEKALSDYTHRCQDPGDRGSWAGVSAILGAMESGQVGVLLIQRSEHPKDPWSGHMAMPGGRKDPGDLSTRHAAERETREEVGIDLVANARYIGRLGDVTAVARGRHIGLTIAPHVYYLEDKCIPVPNEEVQAVVWVPLADLASSDYRSTLPYDMGTTRLMLPCWRWHERVIWGLTYGMLDTLLRVASDG